MSDQTNATIRKITPSRQVSTVAGLASPGAANGTGSAAHFAKPSSVAVDNAGNAYVADTNNYTLRKITPAGAVTTLAGSAGNFGSADGSGSAARFGDLKGVAVDTAGNVFVADTHNSGIRKVTPGGAVTTVAVLTYFGFEGFEYDQPEGVALDSSGNLFVAATASSAILKITPNGTVTTFAGYRGVSGNGDGMGEEARFNRPSGIAVDGAGNVFVADTYNSCIRKITPQGLVSTLTAASYFRTRGVAADSSGNVYFADTFYGTIRKIAPGGEVTAVGGDPTHPNESADGLGTFAHFWRPSGIAISNTGALYIADTNNNTIRVGAKPPSRFR